MFLTIDTMLFLCFFQFRVLMFVRLHQFYDRLQTEKRGSVKMRNSAGMNREKSFNREEK